MSPIDFEALPDLPTLVGAHGSATISEDVPDLWDVIILVVTNPG